MLYNSKDYSVSKEEISRLTKTCQNYFIKCDDNGNIVPGGSYREKLMKLHNKHKDERCFILCNGPSLSKVNFSLLKNEITIGSNGIFRKFPEMGFAVNYFTMEDTEQIEDRRDDLEKISGTTRLFALYNSYCIPEREDTIFMNVERCSHGSGSQGKRWREIYPQFSLDMASSVFLGATITYINLQLAFYLGCSKVYLLGLDHNYGKITEVFSPGKVEVTEEVAKLLKSSHYISDYHKIGGRFGVPYTEMQEKAYAKALEVYTEYGREVYNSTPGSKLNIFPKVDFETIFK